NKTITEIKSDMSEMKTSLTEVQKGIDQLLESNQRVYDMLELNKQFLKKEREEIEHLRSVK
ncbi:hypothetical protein, partial [Bacillus marinisedimentorum]|uniref:hypothetical protein n=1 Tax=Bacillus marinisedimentorum TaxID=1821260 RepID=UPI001B8033FA